VLARKPDHATTLASRMHSTSGNVYSRSHGRNATCDVHHTPRNDHPIPVRGATIATSRPPSLPRIQVGESATAEITVASDSDMIGDSGNVAILRLLDRVSTPESAPSQLAQTPSPQHLNGATSSETPHNSFTTIESHTLTLLIGAAGTTNDSIVHGPDGLVSSGTLPGLVKGLVVGSGGLYSQVQIKRNLTVNVGLLVLKVDEAFRETFLTSYRAFTRGGEVFRLLRECFEASQSLSAEQRAKVRYT
jgi:hypothetical protein